jgi:NDP-sugar pyrophosphorylase family protein
MKAFSIIIAMAGKGERVSGRYKKPKPLIEVHGKPLVAWALAGLPLELASSLYLVTNTTVGTNFDLKLILEKYLPGELPISVRILEQKTSGQAETVYEGLRDVDDSHGILTFNCDTMISNDFPDDYAAWDGILGAFKSDDPGMSYIESSQNIVTRTAEKERISESASTGLYYFGSKSVFREAYFETQHEREAYIAPMYNSMIAKNLHVKSFETRSVLPLGTSSEIAWFENLPLT